MRRKLRICLSKILKSHNFSTYEDYQFYQKVAQIQVNINAFEKSFIEKNLNEKLKQLETVLAQENIWNDVNSTSKIFQQFSFIQKNKEEIELFKSILSENIELFDLALLESNIEILNDCKEAINKLEISVIKKRNQSLFSGNSDHLSCYLQINPGAGGTDSCDWVRMLAKMYVQWSSSSTLSTNLKAIILDETKENNKDSQLSKMTLKVTGDFAYGICQYEAGVHRLVRISPFDTAEKRHTSFAQVLVYPEYDCVVNDNKYNDILQEKDLKVDTFKSSGAGGQSVNTTDSAVRITHLPTGTVICCQNERSQHQNKSTALALLKSKLIALEKEKEKSLRLESTVGGTSGDNRFGGSHIRTVVLHPYRLVKDHRSGLQCEDTEGYLVGRSDFADRSLLAAARMAEDGEMATTAPGLS